MSIQSSLARRGLMLILSSPSGAGKTTLSRRLLSENTDISMSISATTRSPRPGEVDGKDYLFVTPDRFNEMIEMGHFYEHAKVFDHKYGTPKAPVDEALSAGKDVLFDIDWQGAQQLGETAQGDVVKVFILPPSVIALAERLRTRAQDSEEVVQRRMAKAEDEISHWAEYEYVLINDDLDACFEQLQDILRTERLRRHRQTGLSSFVRGLQIERSDANLS